MWDHDPRLQTARYHYAVCGLEYARWQGHRRLHAASSAPGVHPFPQQDRSRNTPWVGLALDRRQLWDAQASPSQILVETTPPLLSSFYSDIEFLVESGRALVQGDYRQANSAWQ